MTLMSLITTGTSKATSSYTSASDSVATAVQKLIDTKTAANTKTTGTTSSASTNGVSISSTARIAAAEAADNAKSFSTLTSDVRKTLDDQYAADKTAGKTSSTPDIGEYSGRALAAIALNRDGNFSSKEVAAAKAELRDRTREQFSSIVGNGISLSGMAAYNQQLVSQYDSMSAEEREAMGWTDKVRSSAAAFVGTGSQSSLFDRLGDIDDWS